MHEQIADQLAKDAQDKDDKHGIMCELMGDMTGYHALASYKQGVHGSQPQIGGSDTDNLDNQGLSETELIVGWVNRMASARCLSSRGRDCLRHHAKVTPHTLSIASEDFAQWADDVRDVLGSSVSCTNLIFHFRFVLVRSEPI